MDKSFLNIFKPYKERILNPDKKVKVYRCLTKSKQCAGQKVYSIQQAGLVVAHATSLLLSGATFRISEKGRQRVIREGQKHVEEKLLEVDKVSR